jgi:hypothetical protein
MVKLLKEIRDYLKIIAEYIQYYKLDLTKDQYHQKKKQG